MAGGIDAVRGGRIINTVSAFYGFPFHVRRFVKMGSQPTDTPILAQRFSRGNCEQFSRVSREQFSRGNLINILIDWAWPPNSEARRSVLKLDEEHGANLHRCQFSCLRLPYIGDI